MHWTNRIKVMVLFLWQKTYIRQFNYYLIIIKCVCSVINESHLPKPPWTGVNAELADMEKPGPGGCIDNFCCYQRQTTTKTNHK